MVCIKIIVVMLPVLLAVCNLVFGIKWLGLNQSPHLWNSTAHCPRSKIERKKYGLIGFQTKLCRRYPELMPYIMSAGQAARHACQQQFEDRRWNCSSIDFAPSLKPDLTKGTREQAYVYALASAILVQQVARACKRMEVPYCPCGKKPDTVETDFKWDGCSDNYEYGSKVSVLWADAYWRPKRRRNKARNGNNHVNNVPGTRLSVLKDGAYISRKRFDSLVKDSDHLTLRAKMNKHNSQVGREFLTQNMVTKCKCHGVSSSCSLKTCWRELPPVSVIAEKLKQKYMRATEVRGTKTNKVGQLASMSSNQSPLPSSIERGADRNDELGFESVAMMGTVTDLDLVYVKKSPDYCTEDRRFGSIGTRGRLCNATSGTHASCDSMCCGRGYATIHQQVEENCHCKYVHCCYVKCQTCRYTLAKNYCK